MLRLGNNHRKVFRSGVQTAGYSAARFSHTPAGARYSLPPLRSAQEARPKKNCPRAKGALGAARHGGDGRSNVRATGLHRADQKFMKNRPWGALGTEGAVPPRPWQCARGRAAGPKSKRRMDLPDTNLLLRFNPRSPRDPRWRSQAGNGGVSSFGAPKRAGASARLPDPASHSRTTLSAFYSQVRARIGCFPYGRFFYTFVPAAIGILISEALAIRSWMFPTPPTAPLRRGSVGR